MAAYVKKLGGMGRLLAGRSTMPPPLFALTADGEEELHAFAAWRGIRRDPGTPATPAGFVQEAEIRHERQRAVTRGEAQP